MITRDGSKVSKERNLESQRGGHKPSDRLGEGTTKIECALRGQKSTIENEGEGPQEPLLSEVFYMFKQ